MGIKELAVQEKIILPENTQREMIKFFLRTSMPKLAMQEKQNQQTSPEVNPNKGEE